MVYHTSTIKDCSYKMNTSTTRRIDREVGEFLEDAILGSVGVNKVDENRVRERDVKEEIIETIVISTLSLIGFFLVMIIWIMRFIKS
jgi:hypothetical protein